MDEAAQRDLERWRGGIDEGIKNLVKAIDGLHLDFKDERETARLHRESLRSVIGANSTAIATLSSDVKDLKDIKPTVQALEASHNKAKGVVWLARAMWGIVAMLLGAVLAKFGLK